MSGATAFPIGLPADLDDAEAISANDWAAFRGLSEMASHWERPGWFDGQRSVHWMITLGHIGEVREFVESCQVHVDREELDRAPLDSIHLTIGRVGFVDELSNHAVHDVARAGRDACRHALAFPMTVGPIAGSRGAVRCSVSPWSSIITVHRALTSATRSVLGDRCVMDTARFRPHVGVAYANRALSTTSIIGVLQELRSLPAPVVSVDAVSLVELRRDARSYRYREIDRVALLSSAHSAGGAIGQARRP